MNKSIFILGLGILTSLAAQAYDTDFFKGFTSRLEVPPAVIQEINGFKFNEQGPPEGYADSFLKLITHKIQNEKILALTTLSKACKESVSVSFAQALLTPYASHPAVQEFESGLIRIELSACYSHGTPTEAIRIFSDPDFQNEALNTLKESHGNGALICDTTEVTTIGTSKYCYLPVIESSPQLALHHHFNITNDPDPKLVKVYFRELFATAQQTDSGIAFHLITYIRSAKISGLKKMFARNVINLEQNQSTSLLREKLK